MVRFPDRAHRPVGVLAQRRAMLAARAELPDGGAEVGAAEHGVGGEADEHEQERRLGERHRRSSACGRAAPATSGATPLGPRWTSTGARASRRRIQTMAATTPA